MIARSSDIYIVESAAFAGELCEQGSEYPVVRVQRLLELLDAIHDWLQSPYFCSMHWPAAESRESIAVAVHDIDITGALCNAFFQNTGALVG